VNREDSWVQPDDRVLLIDLENTVGSCRAKEALIRRRVGLLLSAAGPLHHAVASYAVKTIDASEAVASTLADLGVTAFPAPDEADAAEKALLRHAEHVHARGGRLFTVASGDHRFTALKSLGKFDILLFEGQPLSARLAKAGGAVRRIPRDGAVVRLNVPTNNHRVDVNGRAGTPGAGAAVDSAIAGGVAGPDSNGQVTYDWRSPSDPVHVPVPASPPAETGNRRSDSAPAQSAPMREFLLAVAHGFGVGLGHRTVDLLLCVRRPKAERSSRYGK
jgi:hypothetical protein